ncbi:MAG: SDR family NAD(P)-dependent oxidoreductase [Omnitrophica WOR_2 bacterium]
MKVVVITGSTRGIGYGLADSFLALGCTVVINGRSREKVDQVVQDFSRKYDPARVMGYPGDVSDFEQVQSLWNAAKARFIHVDIWINNAGIAQPQAYFWDFTPKQIRSVVDTNIIGAMYGTVVAIRGMREQGYGSLYNMEGYGSSGRRMVKGVSLYGSTKAALRFLDDSLMDEVEGTPVIVGVLRPGMVATELITSQYENRPEDWERARRIFNIIADRVETVTPWLAQKILENQKSGVCISWTNPAKLMFRFLAAPFRKRRIVD